MDMKEDDRFSERTVRHERRLKGVIRRHVGLRLGLRESVSDLFQSVLRLLWKGRAKVPDDTEGFMRYFDAVAKNKAADRARYYEAECRAEDRSRELRDEIPDRAGRRPEVRTSGAELLAVAGRVLREPELTVFVRCIIEGATPAELGVELGERANTVAVRLHRAKAKVALELERLDPSCKTMEAGDSVP